MAEPVPWPGARPRRLRKPRVSLAAAPRSEEARRQKRSLPLPPPPPPIVHRRTERTEPTALPPPPPPSPAATAGLVAEASTEALTQPGKRLPRFSLSPATPLAQRAAARAGAGLLAIAPSPGKEQLSQPSFAWKMCRLQWQLPLFPRVRSQAESRGFGGCQDRALAARCSVPADP